MRSAIYFYGVFREFQELSLNTLKLFTSISYMGVPYN